MKAIPTGVKAQLEIGQRFDVFEINPCYFGRNKVGHWTIARDDNDGTFEIPAPYGQKWLEREELKLVGSLVIKSIKSQSL